MKFRGKVFKGNREGTKLGFPTANIRVAESIAPGIYAGYANLDEDASNKQKTLFYVSKNENNVIECHILDFPSRDLYDLEISGEILHKLRDVQRFSSLKEARKKIKQDEQEALEWFKNNQN